MAMMSFLSKLTIPRMAVRGIQIFFALLVLILSSYVTNWYNTSTLVVAPPQINVMIATSILSLISVAVLELLPKYKPSFTSPFVFLAIESANVLFWFASGIALAMFLGRLDFCRGSVCAAAQTSAVLAYVMFGAWLGTLIPLAVGIIKGNGRRAVGGPSMSGAAGMTKEKEVA